MTKDTPSIFVTTVDVSMKDKLLQGLISQGFEIAKIPYAFFSAKKKGVSCTFYESGKLTVQGKDMAPFIEFFLEPEILGNFSFSHPDANLDLTPRLGGDESGKGDFFGPLVVACVYGNEKTIPELVRIKAKDSKALTDETALKISKEIQKIVPYKIIRIFPEKYNSLYEGFSNLNSLLAWAHAAALSTLHQETGCPLAIVDQFANESVLLSALRKKEADLVLKQRHRAEEDVVVASASILARAAFLEGLKTLSEEYKIDLPKGASKLTIQAGKKLKAQYGDEALRKTAKLHFKTYEAL
ncbi:ribonuclease HIII [Criblamydia sequanensis]|uniref:Ribonuclease HIII n=1 Tax=Candidatus Criblamydia sequanensis CRIB-18 TaxID=1437425 RepID=A0A090D0Q8_9BACT|nr:ribonuclease HIII [Criblamydia sequanensis]CDR35127.1 Ribonuclease HIII [Criblamydia sequanensis CRIB-18]